MPRALGLTTWHDAAAQRCRHQHHATLTTGASAAGHQPHGQHLSRPYSKQDHVKTKIFDEQTRQENDTFEAEFDWSLDKSPGLSVAEQEARFTRSPIGKYECRVLQPCPACGMNHGLSFCPFVFEDNPRLFGKTQKATREFDKQMAKSQEFRDTVAYMRKTFVSRKLNGYHGGKRRIETQDAPPLARSKKTCLPNPTVYNINLDVVSTILIMAVWLSKFDPRVNFHGTQGWEKPDGSWWAVESAAWSNFSGYYPTLDDDGKPFLILFANSASFDEQMTYGMSS